MDATRYALHGELGEAAKTEAYLAELQRRINASRKTLRGDDKVRGIRCASLSIRRFADPQHGCVSLLDDSKLILSSSVG
jgi:hypothetical protein